MLVTLVGQHVRTPESLERDPQSLQSRTKSLSLGLPSHQSIWLYSLKKYFRTPSSDVVCTVSCAFGVGQRAACCEQGARGYDDFI
jgi:hypothetical protein